MKVVKSLKNRDILLKGTTKKITSQEGWFLNFLRLSMTAGLPLMKIVLTSLAKNILFSFGLSAGMSAAGTAIQNKIYRSSYPSDLVSHITALIISNEEMEGIIKIVKSLQESGLLMKRISETIKTNRRTKKRISFSVIRNISC